MLLPSKVECLGPSGGAGACISRPLPVWLAVEKRGKALNARDISTQNDPEFTQIMYNFDESNILKTIAYI